MSRPQRWFGEGQGMDSTSPLPAYPDYEEINGFFRIFRIFNVGYLCPHISVYCQGSRPCCSGQSSLWRASPKLCLDPVTSRAVSSPTSPWTPTLLLPNTNGSAAKEVSEQASHPVKNPSPQKRVTWSITPRYKAVLRLDHAVRKSVHIGGDLTKAGFCSGKSQADLTALKLLLTCSISAECSSDLLKSDYESNKAPRGTPQLQGTDKMSPTMWQKMALMAPKNWPSSQRISNGIFS